MPPRGEARPSRLVHTQEFAGSNPAAATMATDADEIRDALAKPAQATVTPTSTSVTERSIDDHIKARKFANAEAAADEMENGKWPFQTFVISPPGAIGQA